MRFIEGVVAFEETQQRGLEHRYEVDSNVRGEPLEVLVSPVARSFTIRRPKFYHSDLISALGYADELKRAGTVDAGLLSQEMRDPFIIIKVDSAPDGKNVGTVVTFYRGCKIGSIRERIDVEGGNDLGVFEEAEIFYAGRQQFTQ